MSGGGSLWKRPEPGGEYPRSEGNPKAYLCGRCPSKRVTWRVFLIDHLIRLVHIKYLLRITSTLSEMPEKCPRRPGETSVAGLAWTMKRATSV
jgi:hypothetical protein